MLHSFFEFTYILTAIGHFEAAVPMHHVFLEFSDVNAFIVLKLKLTLSVFKSKLKFTPVNIPVNRSHLAATMWQPINKTAFVYIACLFVSHLAHFPEPILKTA